MSGEDEDMDKKLAEIRKKLDDVDLQIQALLNQRATLALEVAKIKEASDPAPAYYRPEREAQILKTIAERNKGPMDSAIVVDIFRQVLTACLALQQKIKIAFLGPEGTFSHAASLKHFGKKVQTLPATSIQQVFHCVDSQQAHYGVVPIENSTTGVINTTLDALTTSPLYICGEIILPIHHYFLRRKNNKNPIKRIYSHEQSFAQCQNWLNNNFNDAEKIPVGSNATAAAMAQQDVESAAIAGAYAAEVFDLEKVQPLIEDNPHNQTRFLVIGRQKTLPSGQDKTSLLISTPHIPGALIELLKPFSDNGVNITLIESRPYQHHNWSYLFFVDIEGHQDDKPVQDALKILSGKPILLNILGSYPKAV